MDQNLQLPTASQIRGARAMLGLTQEHCSKQAGVALSSYKQYEHLPDTAIVLTKLKYSTVSLIVEFFNSCGIVFGLSDDGLSVSLLS